MQRPRGDTDHLIMIMIEIMIVIMMIMIVIMMIMMITFRPCSAATFLGLLTWSSEPWPSRW